MMNKAGFPDVKIVLSNQMDELVIWQIITQIKEESVRYGVDAEDLIKRLAYGVGTRMITSSIDPALDGVYKLVAIKNNGNWTPAIKISENPEKTLNPGHKLTWRLYDMRQKAIADVLSCDDEDLCQMETIQLHHPTDHTKKRSLACSELSHIEPLLVDIMQDGKIIYDLPTLDQIRDVRKQDMEKLYPGVKRIMNPHEYHVSLSRKLWNLKQDLVHDFINGTAEDKAL